MAAFRSFFHFLGRHKGYTAINIIGFSVALGIALLILVYAYQEHSVDKLQKDADRIYVEFVGDADGFHPGMPCLWLTGWRNALRILSLPARSWPSIFKVGMPLGRTRP